MNQPKYIDASSDTAPCDTILQSNLQSALYLAIEAAKESDRAISPTFHSAFRMGLESNLAALRAGMGLRIV